MAKSQKGKIVCNSSPIINLAKIDRLDLIEKLYQTLIISRAVFEELMIKGYDKENVTNIEALIDQNIIEVRDITNYGLKNALRKDLDYGESETIALALEIGADLIILDEKDARDMAGIYNLKKTGFLGILIKAKERGFITSVKDYLDIAISEGFWIDEDLYHTILKELGEG